MDDEGKGGEEERRGLRERGTVEKRREVHGRKEQINGYGTVDEEGRGSVKGEGRREKESGGWAGQRNSVYYTSQTSNVKRQIHRIMSELNN